MDHFRFSTLCVALISLINSMPAKAEPASLWTLNGSQIAFYADGPARAFRYHDPRSGLRKEGVRRGTLLFSGTQSGNRFTGTGYVFSKRCGALPYPVTGTATGEGQIRLYGSSPTALDKNCRAVAFQHDVNEFNLLKVVAASVPVQPRPLAVPLPIDPDLAALRAKQVKLARERQLEEQRLAALQAYSAQRGACQNYDISACDAALASPLVTTADAAQVRGWHATAAEFNANLDACRAGSYPSCNAALASPAMTSGQRPAAEAWQKAASPITKFRNLVSEATATFSNWMTETGAQIANLPASPQFENVIAALLTLWLAFTVFRNRQRLFAALPWPGTSAGGIAAIAEAPPQAESRNASTSFRQWVGDLFPADAPHQETAPVTQPTPPPLPARVKERDTPGAVAAMELALAYLAEVREAERPAFDDEITRKEQLNTLSLAVKQLEKAERLDPDAVLEDTGEDGQVIRASLAELKAEALFLEGLTHHTYDIKRAIPALTKATKINPSDPSAFYVLGLVHTANRNKSAAVAALNSAVTLDPGNLKYRKELNRVENLTSAEIAAYKVTRAGERVFDAGIGVANVGVSIYNSGVLIWNIFAVTWNVLTWPLRLIFRIAG